MLPLPSSSLRVSNRQQPKREVYRSRLCLSSSGCSMHLVIRRCRARSSKTPKVNVRWDCIVGLGSSPLHLQRPPVLRTVTCQSCQCPGLLPLWSNGDIQEQCELAAHHTCNTELWVAPFRCMQHRSPSIPWMPRRTGNQPKGRWHTYANRRWWGTRRKYWVRFQGFAACFPWGPPLA